MSFDFLTPAEAVAAQRALKDMSVIEKTAFLAQLEEKDKRWQIREAQTDPLKFARRVYPGFKTGPHHRKLAKILEAVMRG